MSVKNVIIRKALEDDAEDIAKVSITAWQESYKGIIDQAYLDNLSSTLEHRSTFRKKAFDENPEGHFVACLDNEIIGFCDAGQARFDCAKGEIYAIYVLNGYKGKSIGYQLFSAAKSYLASKNLAPCLTMALTENHSARTFYERQGGQVCGTHTFTVDQNSYPETCYLFN
jgi:ribosomal protein S18 acetylase RimI-like enzyme